MPTPGHVQALRKGENIWKKYPPVSGDTGG